MKALVPTALAGILLAQEFPSASLNTDGTLFTVVISGVSYADVITRIRAWVTKARVGPVLVTDGVTGEELVSEVMSRTRRPLVGAARGSNEPDPSESGPLRRAR